MPKDIGRVELQRGGDRRLDNIPIAFARDHQQEIPAGADHRDARPAAHPDTAPHLHLIIVHHRMGDLVTQNRPANVLRHLLVIEFR